MNTISELTNKIVSFRDARDWKQFHNPKDCAISLTLEATEVLEHFQWKNELEANEHIHKHKNDIAEELADAINLVLLMSHDLNIDIIQAVNDKLEMNERKYPVEKARGKHTKYNKL